jgi:hypothetical protein
MTEYSTINLRRELHFVIDEQKFTGELFVGDVRQIQPAKWACHFSIFHIHPERGKIYGKDPMQSLDNCLRFLETLIRGCEVDGLRVWWIYEGDHAGFLGSLEQEEGDKGVAK